MNRIRLAAGFLPFLLLGALLWPQAKNGQAELQAGLAAFKQERYQQAAQSFRQVTALGDDLPAAADAYFWAARSYMAMGQLGEAGRVLDHFLSRYPHHPLFAEGQYQKTRLPFLAKDYEGTIRASEEFIRANPGSPFLPNAYFWAGESLYSLGRLDEAERIFAKVVTDYPQSFKVEAARYRLSLIEFKRREEQLLRLLKWSHEDFLKTVEEFRRRQAAYEQELAAYRGKPGKGTPATPEAVKPETAKPEAAQAAQTAPEESEMLAGLKAQNAALQKRVEELEVQRAREAESKAAELADREQLLRIKEQALALKESLLLLYEGAK
jgi:tetratricopeptide (TPR) repeat protein